MTKYILTFVGAVILGGAIYGAYQFPQVSQLAGTSAQGSTFNTAKFAGIATNLAAPGANATSSSILNTDANDRYITSIKAGCENVGTSKTAYTGAGLASLQLTVATSSSSAPATNGNTNSVGGGAVTIGTSTTSYVVSTSTASVGTSNIYAVWLAGSYLTFTTNATNTAVCTFGAEYIAS